MRAKLNFAEALDRINDGQYVCAADVQSRALARKLWIAEWHIPGCLSESQNYCLTKADAIESALSMCDNARGALSALRKHGRTDKVSPNAYVSMAVTTIEQSTLGGIL